MTYPSDAQARVGLNKCVDALKRIQILWPSAWRALELLQGSKAYQQQEAGVPVVSGRSERPKRVAEHSLDERDRIEVPRIQTGDQLYRAQQSHFTTPVTSPAQDNQGYTSGAVPFSASTADPSPSSYLPPFDRWNDPSISHFPGNLSTSVLPQQYSTGLVDDRLPPGIGRGSDRTRYPQYWNDYSTIGQMETAYSVGVPGMGDMSQHVASVQGDQQHTMYVPDQYNLFSKFLILSLLFQLRALALLTYYLCDPGNIQPSNQQ